MGDMIGGDLPSPPWKLNSPLLREHGQALAKGCYDRCYEMWPELDELYGELGRQHVARDAGWHLEYLDEAVAADEPKIFEEYADWLSEMLQARGIGRQQVAGAFGFLADGLEAVACTARQEGHRKALVSILRDNQARVLDDHTPESNHH